MPKNTWKRFEVENHQARGAFVRYSNLSFIMVFSSGLAKRERVAPTEQARKNELVLDID
jgi:hypothetical protein